MALAALFCKLALSQPTRHRILLHYRAAPNHLCASSFLVQTHSWGRLLIPASAFRSLVSQVGALPAIYSYVRAFGLKVDDTDTNYQSYFRGISQVPQSIRDTALSRSHVETDTLTSEFGFIARYPALHGRELDDPWVIRQLFVYQKCHATPDNSTWIFIQCPPVLRERILLCARAGEAGVYILVLSYITKNWREYINHLEAVVDKLVGISHFNRLRWIRAHNIFARHRLKRLASRDPGYSQKPTTKLGFQTLSCCTNTLTSFRRQSRL
jgi:hypothetical protein